MAENNQTSTTARISTYLLTIVLIVLALAIVTLLAAVGAFISGDLPMAELLLVIGFIAMGSSAWLLFQSRRRVSNLKIEAPKTMTTVECIKCGFKSVREFQRGDYVYKELDKCQKCDDKMTITAIYKEVKEKEKTYNV
jgi:ABC-type multidrug transport system fused ATPase/permease subunit